MPSERQHARRASTHVKLKDSCDVCSSSKVRCTKEKPSCARCCKYGHRCYYSPARRIGRPHRAYSAASPAIPNTPPMTETAETPGCSASSDILTINTGQSEPTSAPSDAGSGNGTYDPTKRLDSEPHADFSTCDSLILDILQDLISQQPSPSASSAHPIQPTASIKRLSRILICPCSQRLDAALLTAAACSAALDLVQTMVYSAADITPVIGELHQVANLVAQFARRFEMPDSPTGGGVERETQSAMAGLVVEMKDRLQSIMEEATEMNGDGLGWGIESKA
ncbi:hypothetical protein B0T10DRAFT_551107 [Thelonectria olida]|uniref:Zn(2)-C6 fungal-type domain-containing protein n=1 Tax=Thelonectria olida TaxID=1576542 RepID=A0A9P8VXW9_9HYPO|nr:hypothetical protein B0T10DRAFT_551107 [Thelonectria olida]